MSRGVLTSTIRKNGPSFYVLLPAPLMQRLSWRHSDVVVIREIGDKLLIERIPVEGMAIIRTGTSGGQT